ncbi:fumarylacetoacetate hydrolase family protein [Streptomyces platensis]|uniref:fumarylacetoacetate hydrolase family protein n=1 Tax=Streptomyces platensis TaxID=58346 RepID=UPI002ED1D663|nr:fumarylacetoacetate hydrolase family protein [Streptomyces platensis]
MRYLRYGPAGNELPAVLTADDRVLGLQEVVQDIDGSIFDPSARGAIERAIASGSLPEVDLDDHRIGPPLRHVSKIVCVGLNYDEHAAEAAMSRPAEPILFMKAPSSMCGPNDPIRIPPGATTVDYEVELGIVIGRRSLYLSSYEEAADAIGGYTICNDVSDRHSQLERGGQWMKGKSFPTFAPLGPYLVTADEVDDHQSLPLSLSVNEQIRQDSNTKHMIFGVVHLVHYISQFMELLPGDLICTGTPHGVALGLGADAYLAAGDRVETRIEGLGVQMNEVLGSATST